MNLFKKEELQPKRLSGQIREILKKSILEGKVGFNEKLPSEIEISKMLGVSSVTIREALKELETEGLIEKRRGIYGGSFVARPGPEKMITLMSNYYKYGSITPEELVELRRLLEPALVVLAAERCTDDDLKALGKNIREMEQSLESKEINRSVGIEFHRLLADACHNSLISALMGALVKVFEDILDKVPMTLEDGWCDLDFSKKIYDCLRQGKTDKLEMLMCEHFKVLNDIIEKNKQKFHKKAYAPSGHQ